jgi:hypothetical protein
MPHCPQYPSAAIDDAGAPQLTHAPPGASDDGADSTALSPWSSAPHASQKWALAGTLSPQLGQTGMSKDRYRTYCVRAVDEA